MHSKQSFKWPYVCSTINMRQCYCLICTQCLLVLFYCHIDLYIVHLFSYCAQRGMTHDFLINEYYYYCYYTMKCKHSFLIQKKQQLQYTALYSVKLGRSYQDTHWVIIRPISAPVLQRSVVIVTLPTQWRPTADVIKKISISFFRPWLKIANSTCGAGEGRVGDYE